MKKKLFQGKIVIKRSSRHGYGVFADKNFKKGEKIEECYFILTKGDDKVLEDYYFDIKGKYAFMFGFGCIYNHSDDPNADYEFDLKNRIAIFKADRNIKKGEEIFVCYGLDWFKSRGKKAK